MDDPRNPWKAVEHIVSAAYKTLVDFRAQSGLNYQLPEYGTFREYIRPFIEYAEWDIRLDEHDNTRIDFLWRIDRRRELLKKKYKSLAEVQERRRTR